MTCQKTGDELRKIARAHIERRPYHVQDGKAVIDDRAIEPGSNVVTLKRRGAS
jgi:hypothetical protein